MATSAPIAPTENLIVENVKMSVLKNAEGTIKITQYEKEVESSKTKGFEVVGSQLFPFYTVKTMAAFESLIPDPAEQVKIVQRGISSKWNQKVNATLKDDEFEFSEEPYDTLDLLRKATERARMSPLERALKDIQGAGLSGDQLAVLIAQLQAASAPAEDDEDAAA